MKVLGCYFFAGVLFLAAGFCYITIAKFALHMWMCIWQSSQFLSSSSQVTSAPFSSSFRCVCVPWNACVQMKAEVIEQYVLICVSNITLIVGAIYQMILKCEPSRFSPTEVLWSSWLGTYDNPNIWTYYVWLQQVDCAIQMRQGTLYRSGQSSGLSACASSWLSQRCDLECFEPGLLMTSWTNDFQ